MAVAVQIWLSLECPRPYETVLTVKTKIYM